MGLKKALKAALREVNFGRVERVNIPAIREDARLAERLALVTGGTSGIGLEIAKRFLASGCRVVIAGRNSERVESAVASIGTDCAAGLVLDVCDVDAIPDSVETAASLFPNCLGIDILVNAAGINGGGRLGSVDAASWDAIIATNLKGAFFMTQAVSNHMINRGLKGNILNISSSSALRPGWGPYEISKCSIKSMTLGSADMLIKHGIVVNAIAPGPTATAMLSREGATDLSHKANPSGRLATPEEIAELALMLVSDAGRMVVGDTLYVTGGAGTICIDR